LHGDVGHSLSHVVGKVEGLSNGQGVEHVAKANVDVRVFQDGLIYSDEEVWEGVFGFDV
jgi:hypothetical protein